MKTYYLISADGGVRQTYQNVERVDIEGSFIRVVGPCKDHLNLSELETQTQSIIRLAPGERFELSGL